MTIYGYARVSTTDQNLDIQIAALRAAGADKVRCEKVSGTSTNGRQELKTLLEQGLKIFEGHEQHAQQLVRELH